MLKHGLFGWNWRYILTHPWLIIRESYLRVKWFIQRGVRGYCDRDRWDVGHALALILIPMLKYLEKNKHGYPVGLSEKKWDIILKKIVDGLEANFRLTEGHYPIEWIMTNDPRLKKLSKTATEGLMLLGKHFNDLWD